MDEAARAASRVRCVRRRTRSIVSVTRQASTSSAAESEWLQVNVAAIELGLTEYDRTKIHHFRVQRAAAEDVFRTLATEPTEVRRHNPGLEPGRVDIIVGGALILVTIMRTFGFKEMLVSEADILDGLVRSISAR